MVNEKALTLYVIFTPNRNLHCPCLIYFIILWENFNIFFITAERYTNKVIITHNNNATTCIMDKCEMQTEQFGLQKFLQPMMKSSDQMSNTGTLLNDLWFSYVQYTSELSRVMRACTSNTIPKIHIFLKKYYLNILSKTTSPVIIKNPHLIQTICSPHDDILPHMYFVMN